jgi:uridylate kinase
MKRTQSVILKLTGKIFLPEYNATLRSIIEQLKHLVPTMNVGIVVGGGNIFRGNEQSADRGISSTAGHTIGMLATMINGVLLHDLLEQAGIPSIIMSGLSCPHVGVEPTHDAFQDAFALGKIIIFAGGTGLPFVTTDTNALVRALQIDAYEVWKATSVDGIYTADPITDPSATKLAVVSYQTAREQRLGFIDPVACTLAEQHTLPVRVFSIFEQNALVRLAHNEPIGSLLT